MENPLQMEVLMGKSSINGPFSMANQRVYIYIYSYREGDITYNYLQILHPVT